ncbi:hypothetical protein [Tumebacillus flagellatus]|nr:hypothetical protein [Tumebacillus flagellatus]
MRQGLKKLMLTVSIISAVGAFAITTMAWGPNANMHATKKFIGNIVDPDPKSLIYAGAMVDLDPQKYTVVAAIVDPDPKLAAAHAF